MDIELVPATMHDDDTTLRNLYQFYLYDFSRFMPMWRVTRGGRFFELDLDGCWTRPERSVFFIQAKHDLAGFAIVDDQVRSDFTGTNGIIYLAQFFVLAPFQRQGIGTEAAQLLFDRFTGLWEIFEMNQNVGAQHFWRKVIGRYTTGNYREIAVGGHDGIVQIFDNTNRLQE